MSGCDGAPANQWLEQYVAGTLPDPEAEAFEEHYFECPVCFAQVEALQKIADQMRRNPTKIPARVIRWPAVTGGIGAIAALLLITVIGYRSLAHRDHVAANRGVTSSPPPKAQAEPSAQAAISELADLTLPSFAASSLRGEAEDPEYVAGMKAYQSQDCLAAADHLARVPPGNADSTSAQFYSGVCRLKLNQLDAASRALAHVAGMNDAPQQEAALYYLAQVELLRADQSGAREKLKKVVSLHGDFEQRARSELEKLPPLAPGS